ncbi:MAG: hypothetical protein ACI8ZN_000248 [Bacteroidia bacterium]|jgi:hypothetical protein
MRLIYSFQTNLNKITAIQICLKRKNYVAGPLKAGWEILNVDF